jgi:hypothetical protein
MWRRGHGRSFADKLMIGDDRGLNRAHVAVGSVHMAEQWKSGERVSLVALFIAFLRVSLLGFGGGLVWARRIVVEQRRWTGDEEFTDILSLCQFMPGPNIIGIAVCVGARLRGLIGTIAAVSGFVLIPCVTRLLAWAVVPSVQSSRGLTEYPYWSFRRRSRAADRDRDQDANTASKPPANVDRRRAGIRRNDVHETPASCRTVWGDAA